MNKAVFLDRDGVINIEKDYLYKIRDFEFIDGIFDTLKELLNNGFILFIITNQSGIARGFYTEDDFKRLNSWMLDLFYDKNIKISQVEFCPHKKEDNCNCRKPKTGMIDTILKNFDIDLENSWLIGDKFSDIECAINANIKNTIQVKSGHKFDEKVSKANYICQSIKDVPRIIIS